MLASCCSVLVVYGIGAWRDVSRLSMPSTVNGGVAAVGWPSASMPSASATALASASVPSSSLSTSAAGVSPRLPTRRAANCACAFSRMASTVHDSLVTKASISASRSTTRRTATDWTRPADSPVRTLRQSSGLSL